MSKNTVESGVNMGRKLFIKDFLVLYIEAEK